MKWTKDLKQKFPSWIADLIKPMTWAGSWFYFILGIILGFIFVRLILMIWKPLG